MCNNIEAVIDKRIQRVQNNTSLIHDLYNAQTNIRRSIINGVGSLDKTFGVMDSDDETVINEQLFLFW